MGERRGADMGAPGDTPVWWYVLTRVVPAWEGIVPRNRALDLVSVRPLALRKGDQGRGDSKPDRS
jgi:hypothetical protein